MAPVHFKEKGGKQTNGNPCESEHVAFGPLTASNAIFQPEELETLPRDGIADDGAEEFGHP